MIEEIYDVVDTKGKKIGTATWTEVHTKGLLHQNVHGILFQDKTRTKTLIKKRTTHAGQEAGKYEIAFAGHMLSGEKSENSIRRELHEELFHEGELPSDIFIEKVTTYFNNDIPNNNEIAHLFVVIHKGPFKVQKNEASRLKWVTWKNLVEDMLRNPSKYAQYSINAVNAYIEVSKTTT